MRIIFDGKEAFTEYLQTLESAKKSIWISCYMLRFDLYTRQIWHILERKYREGVDVKLYYDVLGSLRSLPRLVSNPFCQSYTPRWYRPNNRNHSKLIVVDGKTAIVSGRNFTQRYFKEWVDTSTVITEKHILKEIKEFQKRIEQREAKGPDPYGPVRYTDPLERKRTVYNFVLEQIATARKRIVILSPYFVLDDALESLLLAAAERNVKILIIVPKKPEHRLSKTFNRINFQRIHHKNVTVKRSRGMFHSKVMLFDDTALVGSANFDPRSFKYNTELSVVLDPKHIDLVNEHVETVAHTALKYNWIQRAYDTILFNFTRHLMELL